MAAQNLLPTSVLQALEAACEKLWQLAENDLIFENAIITAFGEEADASSFRTAWVNRDFSNFPEIEIRSTTEINGANGAFAAATGKIYLAQEFIDENSNKPEAIVSVVLEEYGHFVDSKINKGDAIGDEGEIFSALVQGRSLTAQELTTLRAENDRATVIIDSQTIQIEQDEYWNGAVQTWGDNRFTTLGHYYRDDKGNSDGDMKAGLNGSDEYPVYGYGGNDTITGGQTTDYISGGDGDDTIIAEGGDDKVDGDDDNDVIFGGEGNDTLNGGDGDDHLDGDLRGFTPAEGSAKDTIYGQKGNDLIWGGEDGDFLYGGEGKDTIYGEDGNDELHGEDGNDEIWGGEDSDTLYGGKGDDHLWGGDELDVIFDNLPSEITAEKLFDADVIYGNEGNDTIWGGKDKDTLDGGGGGDNIYGGSGDDILYGGFVRYSNLERDQAKADVEADSLYGGSGNDTLTGGGKEFIRPNGGKFFIEKNDLLKGGTDDDTLWGDSATKSKFGKDTTHLAGDDELKGEIGNDFLYGMDGTDDLDGGNGNDFLDGGDGADTLDGGNGNDILFSGPVSSGYIKIMTGGEGVDGFILGSSSKVEDERDTTVPQEIRDNFLAFGTAAASFTGDRFAAGGADLVTALVGALKGAEKSLANWDDYTVIKDFGSQDVILSPKALNIGYGEHFEDYNGLLLKMPIKDKTPGAKTDVVAVLDGFNKQGEQQLKLEHTPVEVKLLSGETETWHSYYVAGAEASIEVDWSKRNTQSLVIDKPVFGEKKIVGGYYPEWGIFDRNFQVQDVPADELTHLFYAFAQIDQNGKAAFFDPWASKDKPFPGDTLSQDLKGNLNQLRILKEQNPDLKNMLSIGGWSLSGPFSTVAATPESRETFAKSAVELMSQYRTSTGRPIFDGLDIDWEFPVGGGPDRATVDAMPGAQIRANKEVSNSPADKQNYSLLLEAVRYELNNQEIRDNRPLFPAIDYQLSIASAAGAENMKNIDMKGIAQHIDFFNVMTYDFHGPSWEPNQTNHQAALYGPGSDDVDSAIQTYVMEADSDPNDAFERSDIVMGAPLYGRGWVGVPNVNDGLLQPANGTAPGTWEAGVLDYEDLYNRLKNQPGVYKEVWDDVAQVPYIYSSADGGMFSTYENMQSIGAKTDYVRDNGLGGMFFWDLSSDLPGGHPDSLVSKASYELGVSI